MLVRKGLVGLHRSVQIQLLQHYWSGHRLGLLWYWMVCLGNRDHSVIFETVSKHSISDSFVLLGLLYFFKGILAHSSKYNGNLSLNSRIPGHFSLLIPKMSMVTFAISCLTTSNLHWFMNLTFWVPMQYCPLQHQTLLPSSVTSTAGCCFCFGSISSFLLD